MDRALDELRETIGPQELDWDPLHDALPIEHRDGFMWMYWVEWEGRAINVWKHGITPGWLHLDHDGRALSYRGGDYLEVPVEVAVDKVFDDIEAMGFASEGLYTKEYRRDKCRRAREFGGPSSHSAL